MARIQSWVGLCTVLVLACSSKPGPSNPSGLPDASVPTTDGDAGVLLPDGGDGGDGAGRADGGFRCHVDDDCVNAGPGLRCHDVTGQCIRASLCNLASDCPNQDPDSYCADVGCRCVKEVNGSGFEGVCRRRLGVCDVCKSDSDCGVDPSFDPQGRCLALPGETVKRCFHERAGTCAPGMTVNGQGFCVPASGRCDQMGCAEDKDCSTGMVCHRERKVCEVRCRWDFETKAPVKPGCPDGQTCWVDQKNLNPESPFYGAGRCRLPCASDTECTDTTLNPYGGPGLTCSQDGASKRCRANGDCMDFRECPTPNQDQYPNSHGYCDLSTFACQGGCRTGQNALTQKPYADCVYGYKCAFESGANRCVRAPCTEQGGASNACETNQYCSGEDRTADGVPDLAPSGVELDQIGCYNAPSPPFCRRCSTHLDCNVGNLSGSTRPNLCVPLDDGSRACFIASNDDFTLDPVTGNRRAYQGCPNGYTIAFFKPPMVTGQEHNCLKNSDCGPGGECAADPDGARLSDGVTPWKVCVCSSPKSTTGCPVWNNIQTTCRNGENPKEACIIGAYCYPGPAALQKCGF